MRATDQGMTHHQAIRVSLLGGLAVIRLDGTRVAVDEWRTGKTMDLLRLLALSNGRPVRTDSLIDKLWPDVGSDRAGASLRTAVSQIRRTARHNCVGRSPDGLVLQAWVDVGAFEDAAQQVKAASHLGHHGDVLAAALTAERLYRGDFHAHDDDGDWARAEREHLTLTRLELLCDAAEAALALGSFREALELATTAARIDRGSESAHRALMRAYAELGDIGSALRVFETYRAFLADEFGADPSRQTRDLHVRLLRGGTA